MLLPRLVERPNRGFALDIETPERKQDCAHCEDGRRSRPDVPTMEAADSRRRDAACLQDSIEPCLELPPEFDDSLPRQVGVPSRAEVSDELREPSATSVSWRHGTSRSPRGLANPPRNLRAGLAG